MWVENPQHRYSTSFAHMLQNNLHVFVARYTLTLNMPYRGT